VEKRKEFLKGKTEQLVKRASDILLKNFNRGAEFRIVLRRDSPFMGIFTVGQLF